ncbi:sugar transferase [Granulicella sp. S190]|uniref:sugar transferase n=1 Tax=Granulicella sp. S190 TaxID=1747226 RepID=UPI00131E877F|nr:sugar transferase [Granulicella sp. S190]
MTPSNRKIFVELVELGDICLLFGSLAVAYVLTSGHRFFGLLDSLETHHPIQVFSATLVLAVVWHGILRSNRFYRSRRVDGFLKEVIEVCLASFLCALAGFCWLWLISSHAKHSAADLGLISVDFGVISSLVFLSTRVLGRAFARIFRAKGYNLRHVLIIGTNERANGFAQDVALHPEWGYDLLGFVDDHWWSEETEASNPGELLGGMDAIPSLLRALPIDEVIVALPLASYYQQIAEIVALCRDHGIAVRSIGTFFDQEQTKRTAYLRGGVGTITLHDESWNAWGFMIKRVTDAVVSALLLIALAPVFLVISALIRLTSKGPVFFRQTRIGFGKRPFEILKFRTMVQDAEKLMAQVEHLNETQGPTFKLKNDPRITPLGKFLRKSSLDEIPQLINVLLGDMSLVGPRPLPVRDYEGFEHDWHRRRFSVKPGITCLWQIMGRSSITFDEWMALDMRYIDQWSVWLDIKILFQTIPAVFRGSGAV